MWICLNDAFFSAVQDEDDSDIIVLRARNVDHLRLVFPHEKIIYVKNSDYVARIRITKEQLKQKLAEEVDRIKYTNFKNSVVDDDLHDLYSDFWAQHLRYQYSQIKPKMPYKPKSKVHNGKFLFPEEQKKPVTLPMLPSMFNLPEASTKNNHKQRMTKLKKKTAFHKKKEAAL